LKDITWRRADGIGAPPLSKQGVSTLLLKAFALLLLGLALFFGFPFIRLLFQAVEIAFHVGEGLVGHTI